MKSLIIIVCTVLLICTGCSGRKSKGKNEIVNVEAYTIENCINEFSQEDAKETKKGWAYWHVPRDISPTFNFKVSHVGPLTANHADHTHEEEEIFYILEGTAAYSFNGGIKIVGPKSTMFCPSGIPHGISNASDKPLTYAVIKANYPKGIDSAAK